METTKKTQTPASKFTSHALNMSDRKKAALTGITAVESSDAAEIILDSCLGKLSISGSELKIERYDVATGELALSGSVDAIKYVKAKQPLIKRIFK